MKTVIITGVPGTGKTALSRKLAKRLGFHYIDANKIISKYKLSEGYDKKRKTKIVNVNKLNKALIKEINYINEKSNKKIPIKYKKLKKINGIIIDSHLSHYLPRKYVDFCIVTKCDIRELSKRLKRKRYSIGKIQENLQAEIFDICLNEARQRKHKTLIADTTKGFNIDRIIRKISE